MQWNAPLACGFQFSCVQLFIFLHLGISCACAPCQYPCMLALGHTLAHTYTQHQAAGQRQLCSLKGKVNSCACDSWSSHDIPSPNIGGQLWTQWRVSREGSIYSLDETPKLQPATRLSSVFPKRISSDNVRSNEFLLGLHPI